jgi:hypothetical protein
MSINCAMCAERIAPVPGSLQAKSEQQNQNAKTAIGPHNGRDGHHFGQFERTVHRMGFYCKAARQEVAQHPPANRLAVTFPTSKQIDPFFFTVLFDFPCLKRLSRVEGRRVPTTRMVANVAGLPNAYE